MANSAIDRIRGASARRLDRLLSPTPSPTTWWSSWKTLKFWTTLVLILVAEVRCYILFTSHTGSLACVAGSLGCCLTQLISRNGQLQLHKVKVCHALLAMQDQVFFFTRSQQQLTQRRCGTWQRKEACNKEIQHQLCWIAVCVVPV